MDNTLTLNSSDLLEVINENVNSTKYLTSDELNLYSRPKIGLLSLIHLNARSLHSKFPDFKSFVNELSGKFDVIAISETWFNNDTCTSLYNLDGYSLHYASRKDKQGGGVALYILNSLNCRSVKTFCFEDMCESIFVELTLKKNVHVLVSCIYRKPGSCVKTFCDKFRPLLHEIIKPRQTAFICGDFNVNLLKHDEHNPTRDFIDFMCNFNLKPTINKPTRITRDTQTLIDNIFTNEIMKPIETGIIISDLSDHLPIFIEIKLNSCQTTLDTNKVVSKRKLDEVAISNFKHSLQNIDWSEIVNNDVTDVNHAYDAFLEKFLCKYNSSCPVRSITIREKKTNKPWMTTGLRRACHKKNSLYKKYLFLKNDDSEQEYKRYKNNLTTIIRTAEKNYYHRLLQTQVGDMRNMWRSINSIIGKGKTCESFPKEFIEGDRIISCPKEICNGLNKFFTEIGPKLANEISVVDKSPLSYIQANNPKTMSLRPVSEEEVVNIVKSCKKKISKDHHDLSMTIIHNIIPTIKTPLTHICNMSLASGVFPEQMKIAKVVPLFKAGDKGSFNNYRPVSLLPQFSKILEKIFLNRLDSFLEDSKILSECQFGFRSKCNTTHAILQLIENITDSLDNKKSTIGIFIDLKKAFDTVNHGILTQKLNKYGIRGMSNIWIKSYLNERKQYVCMNNIHSQMLDITCGVPQGSLLGPKLFILYINDMCNISKLFNYILFADDTNLYCSGENLEELNIQINESLAELKIWFSANKLSLNIQKTNYMLFSNTTINADIRLLIGDNLIERVHSTKFLGVIIQDNLSWKGHINHICSKMMRVIGVMNRVKFIIPSNTLRMLYNTLLLPHITYACEVWGSTYPSILNKIVLIQKKALRIIYGLRYLDHCEHLFNRKVMKLQKLVQLKISTFMYKIKNQHLPLAIQKLFPVNNQPINSRQQSDFHLPYGRTHKKLHCLSYSGIRLWNTLPLGIRNSPKIVTFKRLLIDHMFQSE